MRIYLQETGEFLFEIPEVDIGDICLLNQKHYYVVCVVHLVEKKAFVKQIEFKKNAVEKLFENHIICPYCSHELMDSWEHKDIGKMECGRCGSIFDYIREVSVSYSTYPDQAAEVIEIRRTR